MESLVDGLGKQLATMTTRRRFLRRAGKLVAAVGSGLIVITSTQAASTVAKAQGGSCPCQPEPGGWCPGCPGDPNSNGGCPGGYTYYYGWWCCINGVGVKCSDCQPTSGSPCTCSNSSPISC